MRKAFICIILIVASQNTVLPLSFACSVCFLNDPSSPFTLGLRLAVLTLFVALLVVLVPLTKFFLYIRSHSRSDIKDLKSNSV